MLSSPRMLMSVGSWWKCVDMLSGDALWWRKKGDFVFLIFGWMKLVQVTLLSETDFDFQSKHIHLMKYCEFACAVIWKIYEFWTLQKRKVVSYVTLKEFWMLLKIKLSLLWYVKWLCKLLVSNAAGRKMWMWRIACHAKLRNSWTKN